MKKIIKILLAMTLCTCFAANGYAENVAFSDVPQKHWAYECINDMVERNVVSGYPDKTFRPDETVSRAEFARMTAGAAELRAEPVLETSFADVAATDWHASFVESVKDFMKGYEKDGTMVFEPDADALREDIVVALVKLAGFNVENADWDIPELKFSDADAISADAKRYVEIAFAKGFVAGYDDNTFRPQDSVTRAEAVALLQRACPKKLEKPEVTPEPIPEATEEPEETPAPTPTPTPTSTPKPTPTPTPTPEPEDVYDEPHALETTLAVVQKAAQSYTTEDGDDVEMVMVLYKGEEKKKLMFETGLYAESGLGVGDVFFFGTNRFGFVDEIFPIYDYSEDEFKHLESKNWSSNLWNEGADYQLAEGYIVDTYRGVIILATRSSVEAGYLDISIDVDDTHENGVAVFGMSKDGIAYEYDAFNENIISTADKFNVKHIDSVKASAFDRYETEDGIFEGDLLRSANYAVVIVENGTVTEIYSVVK